MISRGGRRMGISSISLLSGMVSGVSWAQQLDAVSKRPVGAPFGGVSLSYFATLIDECGGWGRWRFLWLGMPWCLIWVKLRGISGGFRLGRELCLG